MAVDQDIAKHTKRTIEILGSREHGILHKLREMALEVVTIVFAVTLSIWLHGVSEHHHQQQEVRTFLLGLKQDLRDDVERLGFLSEAYKGYDANFAFMADLPPKQPADLEKFKAGYAKLNENAFFLPNASRYEGFKSSGKLTNIEDAQMLTDILSLYQDMRPQIGFSEGGWKRRHEVLRAYLEQQELDFGDDPGQLYKSVTAPKARRILQRVAASPQLYDRYAQYQKVARRVIAAIDKAYPDAAGS